MSSEKEDRSRSVRHSERHSRQNSKLKAGDLDISSKSVVIVPKTHNFLGLKMSADKVETAAYDLNKLAHKRAKARLKERNVSLLVRRPGEPEVDLPLEYGAAIIGRDSSCDIVISHSMVSRKHARIMQNENGHFELIDLGSYNGIFVDGQRIKRMLLLNGDRFMIAKASFKVQINHE